MPPRPTLEKLLREVVANEVTKALAPYLDILERTGRLLAPVERRRPTRTARQAPVHRTLVSQPELTGWDMQVLKYLATDLNGLDLALSMRVSRKDLRGTLRAREQEPMPRSPLPFAVDQIVRVPQLRGTAEATITAIDPVSGDLTLELVEDGRVFQLPSAKANRESA